MSWHWNAKKETEKTEEAEETEETEETELKHGFGLHLGWIL